MSDEELFVVGVVGDVDERAVCLRLATRRLATARRFGPAGAVRVRNRAARPSRPSTMAVMSCRSWRTRAFATPISLAVPCTVGTGAVITALAGMPSTYESIFPRSIFRTGPTLDVQRPSARPSVRVTKRSPYVSLATSVLMRPRASPARPAFSAAFIVSVYAAHTSALVIS